MPCDQRRIYRANLKAANQNLLIKALKSLNLKYEVRPDNSIVIQSRSYYRAIVISQGQVTCDENEKDIIQDITYQYSVETVKEIGRSKGYEVIEKQSKPKNKVSLKF